MKKILHPILDKVGLPRKGRRIGFHAFRHSLASLPVQTTGAKVAQRQLRHSNARTVMEIYAHIILGHDHIEAMMQIESVLSDCGGK